MFGLIFSLLFLCIVFLATFIGFMKGKKHNWQFSLSKTVVVVISALVATVLSALVSWLLGSLGVKLLSSAFPGEDGLGAMLNSLPSGAAIVGAIVAMIIAPIIFLIVFSIVKAILKHLTPCLCRLFMGAKKSESDGEFLSSKKFDPAGAVCGAVCGLVLCLVLFAPVSALLDTANGVVQLAAGTSSVSEIVDAASDNVGINTTDILGGKLIRKGISTYPVNGQLISLDSETELLSSLGKAFTVMGDESSEPQEVSQAFAEADASLQKAHAIPMLLSDLLSAASDDWSQGNDFYGIACPSMGEEFDVVVKDFAALMKDSSYETINEDASTVLSVIGILAEHDGFDTLAQENGALELFHNEEMTSSLMFTILENDRLSPLVGSFTNLGISMFTHSLNVADDYDEMYEDFIADMSSEYKKAVAKSNGVDSKIHSLAAPIKNVYVEYGIDVTDAMSMCIAADMVETLSNGDNEEMKSFFSTSPTETEVAWTGNLMIEYLSTATPEAKVGNAKTIIGHIMNHVSAGATLDDVKKAVKDEFGASVHGLSDKELDDISEEISEMLYKDIAENKLHLENLLFATPDEMHSHSVKVTGKDLHISGEFHGDKEHEAKAIAHAFAVAIDMLDNISEDDAEVDAMLENVGMLFDAFSECEMVGKDVTTGLVTAFFQSDAVASEIGFTTLQATDVANSINEANDGDESYTMLLKSIGQTTNIMKGSGVDSSEEICKLMKDMTPGSSKVLQDITTAETVKNYGATDESAEPVANMFSDMFNNMSDAKQAGISDEQYDKEAKAVNDMMSIAMSAGQSDKDAVFGENSKTGVSASDFIDRAIDSEVVSNALVEAVYGGGDTPQSDPLNLGSSLSREEIAEVESALDEKWQELSSDSSADEKEEFRKKITSIAALLNMEVSFSSGGVTIS